MATTGPIDRLLDAVVDPTSPLDDVFTPDCVFDATVPGWRFTKRGADATVAELRRWYADPGVFEVLERTPLTDGELVEFELSWLENGIPHACHQSHRIVVADGRIVRDTAFCGGRWDAALLAEMGAAHAHV
jgi:hypothetical protein